MRRCVLLALVCIFVSASALAANPQSDSSHHKIHPVLAEKFAARDDKEKLKVIVSLTGDLPPGLARKLAISEQQDRVLGSFKSENNGAGLDILVRYQTLNGFSARLNYGQARALSNHAEVEFLEEMPVHQKLYPESHPLTDVDLAHGKYDGSGAVIAIIDDGIDADHPAFADKLKGGYDFADFDNDPTIDCADQSHGTAVAGVALGNGGGALGVAPGAEMVFLKIQGSGICGSTSLDGDVVGAIDWATANKETYGIDIISMSLGGGLYSSESSCDSSSSIYREAVNNATAAGITVIAASGNDGMCDSMSRPACFSSVVSVGAVYDEDRGNIGWYVNRNSCADLTRYGRDWVAFEDAYADNVIVYSNSASFLDVAAPATCAKTAAPNNSTIDCFGGTSSATPFTSGTAALLVEAAGKGQLSPTEMRGVLVDNGDPVTDPKNGRITPRVNANLAVLAVGGTEPPINEAPTAAFSELCSYLDCSFTDHSTDSDGTITDWNWSFGDGNTSNDQDPVHVFAAAGTYTVSLTVSDNDGDSDSTNHTVTVNEEPAENSPPTASFTDDCTDLNCSFTDTSSDSDGSVVSWSWDFGDGSSSSLQNPSHVYTAGTFTVTLTVTDNDGATDSASTGVTTTDPPNSDYDLEGTFSSQRNRWTATVTDNNGGTLSGSWSASGTESCSGSTCSLSRIHKNVSSVTFTTSDGKAHITVAKP